MKWSLTFGIWRLLLVALMFGAGITRSEATQTDEEGHIRDLVQRGLVLSSDADSACEQFQFELRCREIREDGSVIERRCVVERSGSRFGVMFLSPRGYFTSAVLYQTRATFFAAEPDGIKVSQSGSFSFRAGAAAGEGFDVDLRAADASEKSRIVLDWCAVARHVLAAEGAQSGWDKRAGKLWVTAPGGWTLSVYVDRMPAAAGYPVRAVAVTGRDSVRACRFEIAISILGVGTEPPRTLFRIAELEDGPLASAPFAQLWKSRLEDFGASFDEADRAASTVSLKFLRRFQTLEALNVPEAEVERIRGLLDSLHAATEAGAKEILSELSQFGTRRVWGDLERSYVDRGRPFRVGYDPFAAAARTEIACGPALTPLLYQGLAATVANRELTVSTRCDALDLVGQFGLPLLSPGMSEIEKSLADSPEEELQAVLSSVRARHGLGHDADYARLHRTVAENRLPPAVATAAIEALAIADELGSHTEMPHSLVGGDQVEPRAAGRELDRQPNEGVPRRMRALAATVAGRAMLLDLLEREDARLSAAEGIAALVEAMTPADAEWQRLLGRARGIALNAERPVAERAAANRVAFLDRKTLSTAYTDEFYQSALASDEVLLMCGAMRNMAMVGRAATCYEALRDKLADPHAAKRRKYAETLVTVGISQRVHGQSLPPSFWAALDKVFAHADLEVRTVGVSGVAFLLDTDTWVPASYVTPLVETALKSPDPGVLAVVCVAVSSITRSDLKLPCPPEAQAAPAFGEWVLGHEAGVREHLKTWHAGWQQRQWQPSENR